MDAGDNVLFFLFFSAPVVVLNTENFLLFLLGLTLDGEGAAEIAWFFPPPYLPGGAAEGVRDLLFPLVIRRVERVVADVLPFSRFDGRSYHETDRRTPRGPVFFFPLGRGAGRGERDKLEDVHFPYTAGDDDGRSGRKHLVPSFAASGTPFFLFFFFGCAGSFSSSAIHTTVTVFGYIMGTPDFFFFTQPIALEERAAPRLFFFFSWVMVECVEIDYVAPAMIDSPTIFFLDGNKGSRAAPFFFLRGTKGGLSG